MTIRIGIIGCGAIAAIHIKAYRAIKGVEVVACADISLERARSFATKYELPRAYEDYVQMLASEKLDAVSVCTPNYAHCEPTVKALEAGFHVLTEKPIAMNAREAARMLDTARRTGRLLTVGHHMRFQPAARFLKRLIAAGDLGQIYFGRSHALRRRGVPGWGEFHIKSKSGGGPLIDIGVHTLDLIIWLMGSPVPTTVTGSVFTKFGNRPDFYSNWGDYKREEYDVEDFACGFVKFADGSALLLEASWAAHLPVHESYAQVILGDRGGAQFRPFCNEGAPLEILTARDEALVDIRPSALPEVDVYEEEMKHWIASIRGEAEVLVKPEESLNIQRLIDAIYLSSERGREVVVAEEFKENP
ncbi:MAG: Gfo/Idh/MocA family oxidoreductase [Candidatus Sumerlaeaceae bacterium]|nr:Gfo/Idh/MocA family oxidoreductase [Candidatus Sumerlaeaceae bacterium]